MPIFGLIRFLFVFLFEFSDFKYSVENVESRLMCLGCVCTYDVGYKIKDCNFKELLQIFSPSLSLATRKIDGSTLRIILASGSEDIT
jgi:hypothetical protein